MRDIRKISFGIEEAIKILACSIRVPCPLFVEIPHIRKMQRISKKATRNKKISFYIKFYVNVSSDIYIFGNDLKSFFLHVAEMRDSFESDLRIVNDNDQNDRI